MRSDLEKKKTLQNSFSAPRKQPISPSFSVCCKLCYPFSFRLVTPFVSLWSGADRKQSFSFRKGSKEHEQRYPKLPGSTSKYREVHRSTYIYLKVHRSTSKYLKVSRGTSKYLSRPEIVSGGASSATSISDVYMKAVQEGLKSKVKTQIPWDPHNCSAPLSFFLRFKIWLCNERRVYFGILKTWKLILLLESPCSFVGPSVTKFAAS